MCSQNADGRRLAVIVNEFGDVGIDGEILKSCGIDSLPGGQHRRAGQRLHLLHRRRRFRAGARRPCSTGPRRPSTSSSRPRAWRCPSRWSRRSTGRRSHRRVTVDGVVAVVDGAAVADRPLRRRSRGACQRSAPTISRSTTTIRSRRCSRTSSLCADLVMLNKADLMSDAERAVA